MNEIDSRLNRKTLVVAMFVFVMGAVSAIAQERTATKFAPDVIAKAEKILEDAGLRQAGKVIQSTQTSDISRGISGLARTRRELRLVHQEWKTADDHTTAIATELKRLNRQYGELNLQLARVAGIDTAANNRIVGMINAGVAQSKALEVERDQSKELVAQKRAALNAAEAQYAETVLAIRADYQTLKSALDEKLREPPVQIALRVMHSHAETPQGLTADQVLASIDKRIQKIEQEVFSETIKLVVEHNSLYVDVVVGRKSTRMVVDSGANLISLPSRTADELGILVPADARQLRMILADGREIPARAVMLDRVRVGEFEAENVEAAVLDVSATDAEPLLGMSYLGNFKFEIDMADRSLRMLRVKTD